MTLPAPSETSLLASDPTSGSTSAHRDRIAERRKALRDVCATIPLPAGTPVVFEVGSGHGHLLTAFAADNPGSVCIGVDLIGERVDRAMRKRNRAQLANLHFLHASADDFLAVMPDSVRFSHIFVLFPDPWPKRRHHKNRLMQPPFLDAIARRAGQGTRLLFRTDHVAYFTKAFSVTSAHGAWQMLDEPWPFEETTVFQARAARFHSFIAGPAHA